MAEATDDRLRLLIERIERLEEEKKGIGDDIKDVYNEGKAVGYDTKIMRQIIRLRKMAPDARREMETILDLYKAALGLETGSARPEPTPLEQAIAAATEEELAARGPVRKPDVEKLADEIYQSGGRVSYQDGKTVLVMPMGTATHYEAAVRLVREHDKASTSWLQRQLGIGYNSASALIEQMERDGIVGPPNHIGKRTVTPKVDA